MKSVDLFQLFSDYDLLFPRIGDLPSLFIQELINLGILIHADQTEIYCFSSIIQCYTFFQVTYGKLLLFSMNDGIKFLLIVIIVANQLRLLEPFTALIQGKSKQEHDRNHHDRHNDKPRCHRVPERKPHGELHFNWKHPGNPISQNKRLCVV